MEVWPDNMAAVSTFVAMLTQWRSGGFVPTGLDYGVLPTVLRLRGVPRKEWPDIFGQIRILEDAALQTMNRLAEQERERQRNRRG